MVVRDGVMGGVSVGMAMRAEFSLVAFLLGQ
jgi:hypothetical protein